MEPGACARVPAKLWGKKTMLEFGLVALMGFAVIAAAIYDVATMTIPNWICGLLLSLFPLAAIAAGLSVGEFGISVALGFGALILGMLLFALGYAGGGDAKLFAALTLYMGVAGIGPFVMWVALAGGGLAMTFLILRRLPLPFWVLAQPWVSRLYAKSQGVPYGVAIAAGALVVLPQTDVFTRLMS